MHRVLRNVDAEVSVPGDIMKALREELSTGFDGPSGSKQNVLVDVKVVQWQDGDRVGRLMLGILAPESSQTKISARVTMTDAQTGKVLRAEAIGVTLSSGAFGGSADEVAHKLAKEVVQFALHDSAP